MSETVLVIGAGHAAGQLVSTLRQKAFAGRIVLVGEEPYVPYQRPPLSKKYLAGELERSRLYFKPTGFYADAGVELHLSTRVTTLDVAAGRAGLADGGSVDWDHCVLATGSRVLRLPVPGADLPGVHYLRTIDDVDAIRAHFSPGSRLVVVGAGYIGLEVAAVAATAGLAVTVLEVAERVMSRVVSPTVSEFFAVEHRRHGVDLRLGDAVAGFEGGTGVETVITAGKIEAGEAALRRIPPDDGSVVALGETRDLQLQVVLIRPEPGDLIVDRRLATDTRGGGLRLLQGIVHGLQPQRPAVDTIGMAGAVADGVDTVSHTAAVLVHDATVVRGDPAQRRFACFYLAGGRLLAVDAVSSPREFMLAKPLIASGARPPVDALADPDISLKDL